MTHRVRAIIGLSALAAGALGFILLPIGLSLVVDLKPDCARERNTINYTWPRGCR